MLPSSSTRDVQVWNRHNNELACSLKGNRGVSRKYVISVVGSSLFVYDSSGNFDFKFVPQLEEVVNDKTILNNDVAIEVGACGFLSFISIERKCYLHRVKLSLNQITTFAVLTIALVRHAIEECITIAYPSSAIAISKTKPLQTACNKFQNGTHARSWKLASRLSRPSIVRNPLMNGVIHIIYSCKQYVKIKFLDPVITTTSIAIGT